MNLLSRKRKDRSEQVEEDRTQYLRSQLPNLTRDQIRRFRLPLHLALIEELDEHGCVSSGEYLRQLIAYNEEHRRNHMYDMIVMSRPILSKSPEVLQALYNHFEEAETQFNLGNVAGEIDQFFDLAILFGYTESDDWWWLAEQIFTQIIKMSSQYADDDGCRESQAYYIFGKYLIDYRHNTEEAIEFLNMSRILSKEKAWVAKKLESIAPQKIIFVETSNLLYNIWAKQIRAIVLTEPDRAMEFCMYAKQIVFDACLPKAEIYFLQGKCEMELGKPDQALKSYQKSYNLYKSAKDLENCCEARICLALCYLEMGNWEKTNSELKSLLDFAVQKKMPHYEGLAYLYIGQFNLNQGTPECATSILVKAMNIFHELNDVDQREFVNNLAAISRGQELFADYTNLILQCEGTGKVPLNNTLKLVRWKDKREPFWDEFSSKSESFQNVSIGTVSSLDQAPSQEKELMLEEFEELGDLEEEESNNGISEIGEITPTSSKQSVVIEE